MATVREILSTKGQHVLSIGADAMVLDAALLMNEHKIGSLVVSDGPRVQGIITERDILQRIVAERRDQLGEPVARRSHVGIGEDQSLDATVDGV